MEPVVPMVPLGPPSTVSAQRTYASMALVCEYGILFVAAVMILTIVCVRSTSRLRTRLVYFYISYWADEYVALRSPHRRVRNSTRKRILAGVNVVLYAAEFVILSMSLWPHTSLDLYHTVQSYFLNILYIMSIAAFLLYGFGLYINWKHTPIARKSQSNLRRMRLTLFITIIVTVSFAARVVVNALWAKYILRWNYKYTFEAVYYTVVEALPIGMLLCLMLAAGYRFAPNKHQNTFKPLIAQVHDEGSGFTINSGDLNEEDEDDGEYESESGSDVEEAPGGLFD